MNVLVIDGYLREGGNTASLSDALYDAMREKGWDIDLVGLRDRRISDCRNCGGCADTSACVVEDDMTAIYEKLESADTLVLSTPIYMWHCTALLKAFIDRLYCVTSNLSGKKLALVITAGGNPFDGANLFVSSMQMFAEYCGIEFAGVLYRAPVGDKSSWSKERLLTDIEELLENIAE